MIDAFIGWAVQFFGGWLIVFLVFGTGILVVTGADKLAPFLDSAPRRFGVGEVALRVSRTTAKWTLAILLFAVFVAGYNEGCVLVHDLESMLLGDPPQNRFQQYRPQPVIGRIEIPQRNSTEGMPFLSFKHGRC
jgi:hypothetical protein